MTILRFENLRKFVGNVTNQLLVLKTAFRLLAENSCEYFHKIRLSMQMLCVVCIANDATTQFQIRSAKLRCNKMTFKALFLFFFFFNLPNLQAIGRTVDAQECRSILCCRLYRTVRPFEETRKDRRRFLVPNWELYARDRRTPTDPL